MPQATRRAIRTRQLVRATAALAAAVSLGACTLVYPPFGRDPDGERLVQVEASPNYHDGQFHNQIPTTTLQGRMQMLAALIRGRTEPKVRPAPTVPLPSVKTDLKALPAERDIVIWLGHSSLYVQLAGRRILIDPVLSPSASPFPGMVKAFEGTNLYTVADLPPIDYVLISHDHYDHLDYPTLRDIEPKARFVIGGLGTGGHFERWGWPKDRIREGDWGARYTLDEGLSITVTPARHYSGRTLDRNKTLWVGYVIETANRRIFVSGDSGFGPHFQDIANRFGGFDLVMLDGGQYNERWADIHMTPEQAAEAATILRTKALLPGHAGRFSLGRHPWDEPFQRIELASQGKPYRLLTPRIGEPVDLAQPQTFASWWSGIE